MVPKTNGIETTYPIHTEAWFREISPLSRAERFLERSCSVVGCYQTLVDQDPEFLNPRAQPLEIFTSTLALDLLSDLSFNTRVIYALRNFLTTNPYKVQFNYFKEADGMVANDTDCTAICAATFVRHSLIGRSQFFSCVTSILGNTTDSGVIQTYYPPRGADREAQVCMIACCNALRAIYMASLGPSARKTEDYVYNLLRSKTYEDRANYCFYTNVGDAFLYFLSRAILISNEARNRFEALIVEQLRERLETPGSSVLVSAYRLLTLEALKLLDDQSFHDVILRERDHLISKQNRDGSWAAEPMYGTSHTQIYFGSKENTSLFAYRAICVTRDISTSV